MTARAEKQKAIVRLTEKSVERYSLAVGEERREVYDEYLPRLALRIGRRSKSWSVMYRVAAAGEVRRGELKRLSLGSWPVVDLTTAREKAREALEAADRGIDPAALKTAEVEARQTRTFEVVFGRFVELHVKQNTKEGRFARDRAAALAEAAAAGDALAQRAVPGVELAAGGPTSPLARSLKGPKARLGRVAAERIIADDALPRWTGRLIETISRAEINDLLDDVIEEDGVARARELRKHLSKLFNWSADRGHIVASPMTGMRRPELGYRARERVLSMEELRRIWDAAGALGRRPGEGSYPFGPAYRLLILTGQRRSEVAELQRPWVEAARRAIEIPASHYKTKRPHVIPLSRPAWDLVQSMPRWNGGDYVFSTDGGPGRPAGSRPISGFSKAKELIEAKIAELGAADGLPPIEDWTVHDIRRSVATHMARLGVPIDHIERVLGHVLGGVKGTYQHHAFFEEKRSALEKWGELWK